MSTKVGESTGYVPNIQMSAFGYVMAALLVVIMLPVLPIIVVAWVLWRAFVAEEPVESRYESWRNERGRRPRAGAADEVEEELETEDAGEDEAEAEAEA
ncbi:DUF7535 family protein [Halopiger aswanensis]|uniref:Uncharacterized protein n=1 Tax=Halopiger aswanensis TaxID=148449 RepID=A0A419WI76_9EURY|nr:hypothetical protein [Halopiger aswanensis]RKD95155.1 hypothetical protein ATJ93_2006 [Halopiger aswanensis]